MISEILVTIFPVPAYLLFPLLFFALVGIFNAVSWPRRKKLEDTDAYDYKKQLLKNLGKRLDGKTQGIGLGSKPSMWREGIFVSDMLKEPEAYIDRTIVIKAANVRISESSGGAYTLIVTDGTGSIEATSRTPIEGKVDVVGTAKIIGGTLKIEFNTGKEN